MVVIRLSRAGSHKRPFYHVVAADKRRARDGKFIERLGYFNPVARGENLHLQMNMDRIDYWVSQGAQPSDRVQSLIKRFQEHGTGPKPAKKRVKKKAAAPVAEETAAAEEKEKPAAEAEEVKEDAATEATESAAEKE